jgi:diadenosine tetraphosphate (Ap4A) HIT family hydrolase
MTVVEAPTCPRCDYETTVDWIYQDDYWSLGTVLHVPGWLQLQLRRHAESVPDLTVDELDSIGPTLARVSTALRLAAQAERVYFYSLGENQRHFHIMLIARTAAIPPDQRGAPLMANMTKYDGDPAETQRIAQEVRQQLVEGIR